MILEKIVDRLYNLKTLKIEQDIVDNVEIR